MKSSRWVVCCVALLCLQYVRSEWNSGENIVDDKESHRTEKYDDITRKLQDAQKDLTSLELAAKQSPMNAEPVDICKETCGDVKCKIGRFNKTAVVCKCNEEYEDFIEKDKTCKVNYCKKVCGLNPKVKCDDPYKEKELKDCGCHDSWMYFRASTKSCHTQCHHADYTLRCTYGGQCVKEGKYKFCDCVHGTTGDYCEIVTECSKSFKSCIFDRGSCMFKGGKATCNCVLASTKFYEKGGYCDDKCKDDGNCKYGKFCNEDGFCECPEGLDGYDCMVVPGCKKLRKFCEEQNAECVYDIYAENQATCKCNEKGFTYDPKDKQCKADFCKETCGDLKCEGDPLNKTAIVCKCKEEYEDFNKDDKTCKVNYCKKVCGLDPKIKCDDPYKEKESKDCGCHESFMYYRPSNKSCHRQCDEVISVIRCGNEGQCVKEGKYKFCDCVEGTTGDYCETITECSKSLKRCTFGSGSCVMKDGKATCKCGFNNTIFYEKGGYCEDQCTKHSDCRPFDWIDEGKFCNEDGFCECPEGLVNYNCWDVPGCHELYDLCKVQNATCEYDKYAKNKAICKCNEKGFTYDPKAKQCKADFCKETCGDVKCEGDPLNKTAIVCKCKEEYEEFNEKTKKCKVNYCKELCGTDPEIDCDNPDKNMELEDCYCHTPKFFRPSKIKCQEQCSNITSWTEVHCHNEGVCVSEGDNEFCECPEGTTGDFCENITECDKRFKGCRGDGGKCVFQDGEAKCNCSKENTQFYKKRGYCEDQCTKDDDCTHGKFCNKDGFCACPRGLDGYDCKVVTGCEIKEKLCKEQNAECVYDKYAQDKATCKCNEKGFAYDPETEQCKEECSTEDDDLKCQNGGECGFAGNLNLCKCIEGTTGDFCEKITECDTTFKSCRGDRGECIFEGGKAKCECTKNNTKFYEVVGYCEDLCPKDKKCTGRRICNEDTQFCSCPDGYEGENCKVVTGCKKLAKTCKDVDSVCVFDEDADDKATCKCNKADFVYDRKAKMCKDPFCVNNPCEKPEDCSYDLDTKTGFCKCKAGQYFNYKQNKCEGLADKCLLKKAACGKTEVCDKGKCVCAPGYVKEKNECKPKLCSPYPCFNNAQCNQKDGSCICELGTFFTGQECEDVKCDWNNYEENCKCPDGMERKKNSKKCEPSTGKTCDKSCGYGLCVKEGDKDVCKCFDAFATNVNGTCILKTEVCATRKTTKDLKKCDCSGNQYTRAIDDITCKLITCAEASAQKDCDSKGATCKMRWKSDGIQNPGYYCECPPGYTEEKGKCSDPCSQNKNIEECSKKDQFCYNSISGRNPPTGDCVCPPTLELKDGKCTKLAENAYIIQNIPVLKKRYEIKSGINKVLLNADIIDSLTKMFSAEVYGYGYLYDYRLEDGFLKCSVWINFKKNPVTELKRLKYQAQKFPRSSTCYDCDETITVLPPNLMLSGEKLDKIRYDDLRFCNPEVKNDLCGIYANCEDNKCSCPKGFKAIELTLREEKDFTIQRCEDIDECSTNSHECSKNTTCVNIPGSYGCHCKPGFKKDVTDPKTDKSDCLDLCTPSPCKKGKCNLKKGLFDCECEPGVGGTYCDRPDANYSSAKKGTVIVGAVLGTILCLTLVAFLLYYRKTRKSSEHEDIRPSTRMDNAELAERTPMRNVINKSYQ